MRSMGIATLAGAIGMGAMLSLDDIGHSLGFGIVEPSPSASTKRSVADKAYRAFYKTKLYHPNGARECARRARQASAIQSKDTA